MVITDQFVVLNFPKTGSTFVRTVLQTLHQKQLNGSVGRRLARALGLRRRPFFQELMVRQPMDLPGPPQVHQHGVYQDIPAEHKHKPILSVLRHPMDRLVSIYEYRWWALNPPMDHDWGLASFPHFPDLTFEEFVRYLDLLATRKTPYLREKAVIGAQSINFLQFFLRERPRLIFPLITDDYIDSGAYRRDLVDATFLRMEDLNRDLYEALRKFGYPAKDLAFILDEQKIYPEGPPRSPKRPWQSYYTGELEARVRHSERLLFEVGGYD